MVSKWSNTQPYEKPNSKPYHHLLGKQMETCRRSWTDDREVTERGLPYCATNRLRLTDPYSRFTLHLIVLSGGLDMVSVYCTLCSQHPNPEHYGDIWTKPSISNGSTETLFKILQRQKKSFQHQVTTPLFSWICSIFTTQRAYRHTPCIAKHSEHLCTVLCITSRVADTLDSQ